MHHAAFLQQRHWGWRLRTEKIYAGRRTTERHGTPYYRLGRCHRPRQKGDGRRIIHIKPVSFASEIKESLEFVQNVDMEEAGEFRTSRLTKVGGNRD